MPALNVNFRKVARNASTGEWNRHAVAPIDNSFYIGGIILIKKKKCKMQLLMAREMPPGLNEKQTNTN